MIAALQNNPRREIAAALLLFSREEQRVLKFGEFSAHKLCRKNSFDARARVRERRECLFSSLLALLKQMH